MYFDDMPMDITDEDADAVLKIMAMADEDLLEELYTNAMRAMEGIRGYFEMTPAEIGVLLTCCRVMNSYFSSDQDKRISKGIENSLIDLFSTVTDQLIDGGYSLDDQIGDDPSDEYEPVLLRLNVTQYQDLGRAIRSVRKTFMAHPIVFALTDGYMETSLKLEDSLESYGDWLIRRAAATDKKSIELTQKAMEEVESMGDDYD